jgi:hypothetical protein
MPSFFRRRRPWLQGCFALEIAVILACLSIEADLPRHHVEPVYVAISLLPTHADLISLWRGQPCSSAALTTVESLGTTQGSTRVRRMVDAVSIGPVFIGWCGGYAGG